MRKLEGAGGKNDANYQIDGKINWAAWENEGPLQGCCKGPSRSCKRRNQVEIKFARFSRASIGRNANSERVRNLIQDGFKSSAGDLVLASTTSIMPASSIIVDFVHW